MSTEETAIAKKGESNLATYDDSLYDLGDDEENLKDQIDDSESDENESEFDKLAEGRNAIRLLPPPKGSTWGAKGRPWPAKKVFKHWISIPGATRKLMIVCPKHHSPAKKCRLCDIVGQLRAGGNPVDSDAAYKQRATKGYLMNWINRAHELDGDHPGPKIGALSPTTYDQIVDLIDEHGIPWHPETGYDIVIRKRVKKKGNSTRTEYKVMKGEKCPLAPSPAIGMEWIADQYPLDQYAEAPDEGAMDEIMDKVEPILLASKSRSGGGDGGGRRRRSRRNAQDDWDDGDDDD